MKIVYDKDLVNIKVVDNKEKLVDITKINKDVKVDLEKESRKFFGKNACLLRETVAKKIDVIQKNLPENTNLVLCDCYRPVELQKIMYKKFYSKLKKEHPKWDKERLERECSKFIAPVGNEIIPPHSTGGTLDITILKSGKRVEMGTKLGDLSMKSCTTKKNISKKSRKNRIFLKKIMESEGFVNYPLEWWHWSYGDRYWALKNGKKSIYGSVKFNENKKTENNG